RLGKIGRAVENAVDDREDRAARSAAVHRPLAAGEHALLDFDAEAGARQLDHSSADELRTEDREQYVGVVIQRRKQYRRPGRAYDRIIDEERADRPLPGNAGRRRFRPSRLDMRAGHPQARSEVSGCDARDPLGSVIAESSDRPAEDLVVADLVFPYESDGLEPAGREHDAVLEHDAAAAVVVHADIAVRASRRRDARMDDDLRAVEPIGVDAERRRAARRRDIAVLDDG